MTRILLLTGLGFAVLPALMIGLGASPRTPDIAAPFLSSPATEWVMHPLNCSRNSR